MEILQIQSKIYDIRDQRVMIDCDLAEIYGVETRVLNQAVKRNIERFPEDFMFQLTDDELINWKSQFVISNATNMGLRKKPYVFTDQNDINENTRMQIELINQSLAELQSEKSMIQKQRRRVGYIMDDE
jgi:hypothetical protein